MCVWSASEELHVGVVCLFKELGCCDSLDLPFRHSFWIKATKGDELSRYFCSDSKDDMLKLIAAVVQAKVSSYYSKSWSI